MPWKKYKGSGLHKPNRLELIIILGTIGLGILAVVIAKVVFG